MSATPRNIEREKQRAAGVRRHGLWIRPRGDVPPTGAGSAIAATYLSLMEHVVGWPSPEGGAQRLTDALVGHLRELGGEIRTA